MITIQIWQSAGKPSGIGNTAGTCRVCGQDGIGLPFHDWVRDTFTDWDKLQVVGIYNQTARGRAIKQVQAARALAAWKTKRYGAAWLTS